MASANEGEAVVVARVQELINDIARKEGYNNFKLRTKSLTTDGANYMGDLYITEVVEDDKEPLHLFAKVANTPVAARAMIPANIYYNHEVFVYTTLADTYRELEEKQGVPKENRFNFCKYYGSNLKEMEETIVLEDLAKQGYILYDRLKPIDWNYAKAAIVEIAKMHALSFALKEEDPSKFEKIANRLPKFTESENFKTILESMKKILPLSVAAVDSENRSKIQRYVDENWDNLLIKHFTPNSKYCTIIHGHYRASNILVKYENDKLTSLRPVDYQTLCFGHPINDVLYLLFTGTDAEFRRQHYDECIELYHSRLGAQLKALSLDVEQIYPKSAFLSELKEKLPYGLETALFTLGVVLVDLVVEMVNPDIEKLTADNLKLTNIYSERLNGIVKDFVTWGYLDQYDTSVNVQTHTTSADTNEKTEVIRNIESYVKTIADEEGFKNFKLNTTPMSTEGANYLGDLYYVDVIEDRKETLNLFVKAANVPDYLRKAFSINEVYKHEDFMYSTLGETYHELQERHGVPAEKRFKFPKLYGANLKEMEEMLVLENLATQGYILYDRSKPVDWKYAKAAVEEIAKFHALSFALKKEDSDTFNKIAENFDLKKREEDMRNIFEMMKNAIPAAISAIDPQNRNRVQNYIINKNDEPMIGFYKSISKYSSITHFDYRPSNVMVKYQRDDVVALKPVDYQDAFLGCPIYDILYFIFLGSDEEFRRKHFEEYLEHYHNSLAAHLKLLSQDVNEIYPKSAFYFELKDKMLYGLEVALMLLGAVLVDTNETNINEDITNTDNDMATGMKFSDQYVERLNGIVRDFVRWGYLDEENKAPQVQNGSTTPADNAYPTSADTGEKTEVIRNIESYVRTIADKEGFKNFKLNTTPMSTKGANYLGDLYYVDVIEDRKDTLNLFVKAANVPDYLRKAFSINEVYKHEEFMYSTLGETYHELQERHGVPAEKIFKFPKLYGANLKEMEEMLVLENLATQGYILYDRSKPVDWKYAKAAVQEIAKFHAMSFALKKENSDTFNKIAENFDLKKREEDMRNIFEMLKNSIPAAISTIDPENKNRVQNYITKKNDELMIGFYKSISKYPSITHFDYRPSNVMVKYQRDDVVALKPVDYQDAFLGCPIYDILYFIFLGSDEEFRRKHFEEYLEHYHNSLAAHLKLLSQDVNEIYPKSAFYFELKDKMLYGLEVALMLLGAVLVDTNETNINEDITNTDNDMATGMKFSDQYVERLNGIVRDFVRWGYLDEENKAPQVQNGM